MFGQASTPAAPAKVPGNIDANSIASNQSAIPVPWFQGRRRMPINYIAPVYNLRSEAITTKTGKDQTSTVGYNYFGDVAAVLCCVGRRVPLGKIFRQIIDSEVVWEGVISRDTDFYEPITLMDYGQTYIYWGYANQPRDAFVLTPIGPPPDPAMYPDFDPRRTSTWPNGDRTTQVP